MTELFWERVGLALIGITTGFIYALVITITLFPFIQSLDILLIFKVFIVVFGLVGIFSGKAIINSAQGAAYSLYVLYGYVLGLLTASGSVIDESVMPNRRSGFLFVLLGIVAGTICLLLIYL